MEENQDRPVPADDTGEAQDPAGGADGRIVASAFVAPPPKAKKAAKKIVREAPAVEKARPHFLARHGWKVSSALFLVLLILIVCHPYFMSYFYAVRYARDGAHESLEKLEHFAKIDYFWFIPERKYPVYAWLVRRKDPAVAQAALLAFGGMIQLKGVFLDDPSGVRSFRYFPSYNPFDYGQLGQAMREAVDEKPDHVAVLALEFMAHASDPELRSYVFTQRERMLGSPHKVIRGRYFSAMIEADPQRALEFALAYVNDEDPFMRARAIKAISSGGRYADFVDTITRGLYDTDAEVREAAIDAAAKTRSVDLFRELGLMKQREKNQRLLEAIKKGMNSIEDNFD